MNAPVTRGVIYRCAICGAELTVLARHVGAFGPRCCNQAMDLTDRRAIFYVCPVCGSEVAVVHEGSGKFSYRCCNTDMLPEAA